MSVKMVAAKEQAHLCGKTGFISVKQRESLMIIVFLLNTSEPTGVSWVRIITLNIPKMSFNYFNTIILIRTDIVELYFL